MSFWRPLDLVGFEAVFQGPDSLIIVFRVFISPAISNGLSRLGPVERHLLQLELLKDLPPKSSFPLGVSSQHY